jgi:hypothetical protein
MTEDRSYVVRLRGKFGRDRYVPITDFSLTQYRCGLKAGDSVRLTKDLEDLDSDGRPTAIHKKGEVWQVLSGSPQDPEALWLGEPAGELHSWDDDDSIWDQFERADSAAT